MNLNRRDLLRAAATAGALGAAWPLSDRLSVAQAQEAAADLGARWDPAPFTLGVASGDPLPDGVVLWTRLAPRPLAGTQPLPDTVEVEWLVAANRELTQIVASGRTAAAADVGHSVHVEVGGLEPGRRYYYRFRALGTDSRTGRTRTAPVGPVARVRFASANCQSFIDGYWAAHHAIAREDLDFVVHLGDYVYEYGQAGGHPLRDHEGPEAFTLTDYRRRHALYKGDPSLRDAHAAHPWFVTWDNHEVAGDYSQATPQRRLGAYQAWYEHMPIRDGHPTAPQVRRRRYWGDLLELTVLDLRQYRSAPNVPGATILGAEQKSWLDQGVRQARDSWHCWVNSIMLGQLAVPGGHRPYPDQWDGFADEREEVLTNVHTAGLEDLVVITGDWHSAFVQDIRPDFDDLTSPVIGTEFLAHSIASSGYGPAANTVLGPVLGLANPHLKYFEGNRYGYDLYDVTPDRWSTHLRVIADRRDPVSPVSTLTTFHVDRGKPGSYEDRATAGSPAQYRRLW
ncbi:alkaline phosphatase D family protein [Lentzea sp. NPDC006480]|uniref:alkaline phosphatase D family protein n=1 Tax=Lentzea sp. NPDC006480 TaxID=3157176 RepID=UPI0033BF4C91